jgi:cycloeucalenol cycloisomerase
MSLLASHPGKRALERAWLLYSPVWGTITGVIMLGGFAERWGDAPLMIFGVVLALGTYVAAWVSMPASERALPILQRTAVKACLALTLLAFGLNYFQTPFFFDVLHMRYGFRAQWTLERNPLFLYLVTVAYFATYTVLACIAFRWMARFGRAARIAAYALVPCALAFLETALNANPWMTRLFCYGEPAMMFSFGTAAYGLALALAMPTWVHMDERAEDRTPIFRSLAGIALALLIDTTAVHAIEHWIAPLVTTVEDPSATDWDARGCLAEEAG